MVEHSQLMADRIIAVELGTFFPHDDNVRLSIVLPLRPPDTPRQLFLMKLNQHSDILEPLMRHPAAARLVESWVAEPGYKLECVALPALTRARQPDIYCPLARADDVRLAGSAPVDALDLDMGAVKPVPVHIQVIDHRFNVPHGPVMGRLPIRPQVMKLVQRCRLIARRAVRWRAFQRGKAASHNPGRNPLLPLPAQFVSMLFAYPKGFYEDLKGLAAESLTPQRSGDKRKELAREDLPVLGPALPRMMVKIPGQNVGHRGVVNMAAAAALDVFRPVPVPPVGRDELVGQMAGGVARPWRTGASPHRPLPHRAR
jgi:hypothetical protein